MQKLKASLILEMALSLLIMGILMSSLMLFFQSVNSRRNHIVTVNRANYIRIALQAYVYRKGFLPYAADEDGIEKDGQLIGYLPYKTLGIQKIYAKDGFGKFYEYLVNENLALGFHTKVGYLIVPLLVPLQIPSQEYFCKTFCRLYITHCDHGELGDITTKEEMERAAELVEQAKQEMGFLWTAGSRVTHADECKGRSIGIYKNGYRKIFKPMKIFDSSHTKLLLKGRTGEFTKSSHNYVAWALISGRKKRPPQNLLDINLDSGGIVFWQSRFNLAANLGHPCNSEAVNDDVTWFGNCPQALVCH
jgi:hypothetical protein